MRRLAKIALGLTGLLVLGGAAVVGGIGIDIASASGEVPRNVFIDGYDVSGYGEADLDRVLRLVSSNHARDPVVVQVEGGHPGQLKQDELEWVRQWIDGGALEE